MAEQRNLDRDEEIDQESKQWEAFKAFDHNNDGYINNNDLKFALEHLGKNISEDECFQLITNAETDESGVISYS